jgi:hypothetical protein
VDMGEIYVGVVKAEKCVGVGDCRPKASFLYPASQVGSGARCVKVGNTHQKQ